MRKKWAEGTVLYTRDGAEYKITASNEAGGTAIIYYAEKAGSGIRAVLKEFYPQEWERRKGVPVERAYVDSPDEDPDLLSCYKKLAEQAEREMTISQEVARETVHVWPVRGMLEVQSIREPDGTVWQAEGTLPCCILEMDNLNHKDGLWLQDILREAGKKKSKETPLGNLQPNSKPVLAVPPLQVTLMLVWRLLILLAKIHEAGYLHGDINLGNVFLAMDDKGANVLNAMLIDFGSARALVDGKTAPLGDESVMATPGFAAPELKGGGEQRLTPKADVYAVGKLMHCLLDQNILEALRKGWYSDLEEELKAPTLNASGINDPQLTPAVQKSLDQILSGAAEIKPEKRSSVQEMMEQIMQLYRKIEPPAWQMSLGLLQLNGDEVLGRDKDIKKIEAKLWAEGKLVLHGFSGIGKTKLVTLLGHKWQRNYPCSQVYYAFYPGSMTGLAVDTLARNMSTVAFTEQKDGKEVPRPVAGIIDDMFRELNAHMHENDLLIIDNVDDDTQEYWDSVVHEETVQGQTDLFTRLCQLNCKVLFVTRLDVSNVTGIVPFEVDRLELEPLRAILRENSKDANGHSDAQKRSDEELDRLIALVDRHTMTVDMIARTMRESRLTVPEIYKELSCDGYGSGAFVEISGQKDTDYSKNRIEGHLIRLFRLANFNEREQDMLRYAQLIGENSGMYETLFLSCCPHESKDENTKNLEALNHLLRLGYVQQKTEENSKKIILNLHTLVRVVARKVLAIEEKQADVFLDVMPLPYRRYDVQISPQNRNAMAEAYIQARKVVEKETFRFGYWSSCAAAWLRSSSKKEKHALRRVEYLSDAMKCYDDLNEGLLSVEGVSDVQEKVICLHWNLWNTLRYITPHYIRENCGTTELAREYWAVCLGETDRKLTYPVLFQEYEKYAERLEGIKEKLLVEFYPNNYWDYWCYTDLVDKKEQIRTGKEILKNFERKTSEDYKRYLKICRWLRINAEELNAANGVKDSQRKENVLFEQQEKRAVREYLEFLEEQRPTEYKEIIQAYQEYIRCCERNLNREAVELYCKKLLEKRKSYLDFLMHQVPLDVMEQVMCCNDIIKQYQNRFKDEEKSRKYREISLQIRKDFVETPKRYLLIKEPSNEMQIYISTLNDISRIPGEERTMLTFCQQILKFGQENEKKVTADPTPEEIEDGRYFDSHSKEKICELLQQAILSLEKEKFSEQDAKTVWELLREMRVLLQRLKEKAVPVPKRQKSCIASETEALVHDLQNEEMTDEKDQNYRQVIFSKVGNALKERECEKDIERIINAYEEAGEYSRQQKWLEQIICLQDSGIWGRYMRCLEGDDFRCRMPNGKIYAAKFYIGHFLMEPYYEKAIYAAQKSGDDDKAFELADKMFDIFSKDREIIVENMSYIHPIPNFLAWLRGCSLYAYFCCTRGQYRSALVGLKKAQKDLRRYVMCVTPYLCDQEEVMMAFYKDQLEALKKILPKHHPIFAVQYKLMYPCCMGIKETIKVAKMIIKESILCRFYNWNSSN